MNGYNADLSAYAKRPYLCWRVRGLDKDGGPVGVYSEAEAFNINLKQHAPVATYGDSITHGSGQRAVETRVLEDATVQKQREGGGKH